MLYRAENIFSFTPNKAFSAKIPKHFFPTLSLPSPYLLPTFSLSLVRSRVRKKGGRRAGEERERSGRKNLTKT